MNLKKGQCAKSIERRVKMLEDSLNFSRGKPRIAKVIYNPKICPKSNLPPINIHKRLVLFNLLYKPDLGNFLFLDKHILTNHP